jgi:hypothetical protein
MKSKNQAPTQNFTANQMGVSFLLEIEFVRSILHQSQKSLLSDGVYNSHVQMI